MHLNAHTIALIMAALSASVIAWDCNKEQHQNWCPDYSIGPACFGPMSWGHCDRGCAESVHVADGTWCSGNGIILALGVPMSTPGSQNPAPPPVPHNPGAAPGAAPGTSPGASPGVTPGAAPSPAPNPSIGKFLTLPNPKSWSTISFVCLTNDYYNPQEHIPNPVSQANSSSATPNPKAASNIGDLLTAKPPPASPPPPPKSPPPPTKAPDPPKASPSPDPPKSPAIKPNSPKAPEPKPDPPKSTPPPKPEERLGACHSTLPDLRIKQTEGYGLCL